MMKRVEDYYLRKLLDPEYSKVGKVEHRWLFHKYTLQVKRDGTKIFTAARITMMNRKHWWAFTRKTFNAAGEQEGEAFGHYIMNL